MIQRQTQIAAFLALWATALAFRDGEYIPSARKAQFHEVREAGSPCRCPCSMAIWRSDPDHRLPACPPHPHPPHHPLLLQTRTQWHDMLGNHCPRFGQDRLVALPLPRPNSQLASTDIYKLQLSFDGVSRLLTCNPLILYLGRAILISCTFAHPLPLAHSVTAPCTPQGTATSRPGSRSWARGRQWCQ
jgi:hypothetical protein